MHIVKDLATFVPRPSLLPEEEKKRPLRHVESILLTVSFCKMTILVKWCSCR